MDGSCVPRNSPTRFTGEKLRECHSIDCSLTPTIIYCQENWSIVHSHNVCNRVM